MPGSSTSSLNTSRALTPSSDKSPKDELEPPPVFAIGDKVWVEHQGYSIGGPYWIADMIANGTLLKYYFYNLKDAPGDEGKVKECMPEHWLNTVPNYRKSLWKSARERSEDSSEESGVPLDESFNMDDARERSKMMREVVLEKPAGSGAGDEIEAGWEVL